MATVFGLDDDRTVVALIERLFRGEGHEVVTSTLWSEIALPLLSRRPAGGEATLLICDLRMPGIGGADFARIVRRHRPDIRIVVFTASPGRVAAVEPGLFDAVVHKQAGPDALLRQALPLLVRSS